MTRRHFNGRLQSKFNPFDEDYLAEILEAAAVAWARMKQPSRSEKEDRITFRLAGRLANDPHFAEMPYDIVTNIGYWVWTDSGLGVWTSVLNTAIRNATTSPLNRNGCT